MNRIQLVKHLFHLQKRTIVMVRGIRRMSNRCYSVFGIQWCRAGYSGQGWQVSLGVDE